MVVRTPESSGSARSPRSARSAGSGPNSSPGSCVVKVLRRGEVMRVRLQLPASLAEVKAAVARALVLNVPSEHEGLRIWCAEGKVRKELDAAAALELFGGQPREGPLIRLHLDPPADEAHPEAPSASTDSQQSAPALPSGAAGGEASVESKGPAAQAAALGSAAAVAPLEGGSAPVQDGSWDEAEMNQAKAISAAEAWDRLGNVMSLYGARLRPVVGDGNCQFRALSLQLYGDQAHHAALRARIVEQLRAQRERYAPFVQDDFEEYVKRMEKDREWGDHVTLQAAADVLGCEIHVLTDRPGAECLELKPLQPVAGGPQRPLCLTFVTEVHYDAAELVDTDGAL